MGTGMPYQEFTTTKSRVNLNASSSTKEEGEKKEKMGKKKEPK